MIKNLLITYVVVLTFFSCKEESEVAISSDVLALLEHSKNSQKRASDVLKNIQQSNDFGSARQSRQDYLNQIADDEFVNLEKLSTYFIIDLPYATSDNFLGEQMYDCKRCLLRGEVAKALLAEQKELMRKGYRFKIFDCYRPLSVQRKMWELQPDPQYVADPEQGSVHNRGAAVDLTLTNLKGDVVEMGTDFDDFSEKAHHTYKDLPAKIINNRKLLKTVMENAGFSSFTTEWWHYNFNLGQDYEIEDFVWDCE
ncbi:D-alanyl-D-alanine dipeptidase [Aquimarina sp. ERC-38]|uniref:D-alanyl-D-alanine dipeptidase n=1 Tax=Aquimarina sp. ERC-38 TaxID=2949996 RepID=UPI0022456AF1|nr:D-alanyl-D-alanine dipeptidase [Aquimarina sp. ERC-38]UZO81433.1 D-alanyl-D-alanine dipeptidase [Aquimarina sp. ERC-38]